MLSLKRLLPLALVFLGAMPALGQGARASSIEAAFAPSATQTAAVVDHRDWDALLKAHVRPAEDGLNRVDYRRFKAESQAKLKSYVTRLEATDVSKLGRAEQFAYWVNLYNSKTVDIVLDHYPVRSIRDINLGGGLFAAITGGPWKAKSLNVGGRPLSLDDIEHVILRGMFMDYRVHFAVNCASVGCPNVSRDAFTGADLDAHLERNASAFVNSPRGIKLIGDRVHVSSIFNWFRADFGGTDQGVLDHIRRHASPELKIRLAKVTGIYDYFYDWSLNDASR
ncbi:MAG: DUF547 domain-containing protein [Hyphomicrobiaceae bacterium]|nr:DUF547 domain-containing protein [Hyphomicrobiaceae bacterium]